MSACCLFLNVCIGARVCVRVCVAKKCMDPLRAMWRKCEDRKGLVLFLC